MKILSNLTARNMSNINNFLIGEFNEKKNLLTEASSKSAETISNPLFWATSLLTLGSKQNKQQKSVNT